MANLTSEHMLQNLRKSLNYAFLTANTPRDSINLFKNQVVKLLTEIDEFKTEEFYKTNLIAFLKETYYHANHFINVKDSNDCVIHNDKTAQSSVGVIIEVKRPSNTAEMVSVDNLNKKALQELVLYYLRERILHKNIHLKHCIITNLNEWFIFDAREFERCFAENKQLVKDFKEFENGLLAGHKTKSFYQEIAAPVIAACQENLAFVYFNFADYQSILTAPETAEDKKLIPLFKVLSPEHLLKLSFSNDANHLNHAFYNELLHLIGLEEVKEDGKKLIKRKKAGQRDFASLLEQTIDVLSSHPEMNTEEALFEAAIELCITWINRILFLKLLEAQLLTYHKNDKTYQFFNSEKLSCFADLHHLFFRVLAVTNDKRDANTQQQFAHLPYLNSSLFEETELERKTLNISALRRLRLPLLSATVLKNELGKKLTGDKDILEYLFDFLEAYDFANDSAEEIKANNKSLISASVLGLIFEKINGYQDGSFFTPSMITMYMCRETLRQAVIEKFNEKKGWNCKTFEELQNSILFHKLEDRMEANAIINSLKICDPAVGSGHFLVSALNELIAIKSELKVLVKRDNNRLNEWNITVHNDELKITLVDDDNFHFEYLPTSKHKRQVQEALFHEKQTIIENCLFGVDINPNSVKICRLRLWIELLKNAYYNDEKKLETLPNIDINIQVGNSLMSRFPLDADLKTALKRSHVNIDAYKQAFHAYQKARGKVEKKEINALIKSIKDNFFAAAYENNPNIKLLNDKTAAKYALANMSLIEETEKEKAIKQKKIAKLDVEIANITAEIESLKTHKIYENAFEWRFEFPEALDNEGNFIGFDVVIGNPPYIFARNSEEKGLTQESKTHFYSHFSLAEYQVNLYPLFIEMGHRLLKEKGFFSYITPNNWLTINTNKKLRLFVLNQSDIKIVNFYAKVFDNASVDSAILLFKNSNENKTVELSEYTGAFKFIEKSPTSYFLAEKDYLINVDFFKNKHISILLDKIELNSKLLSSISDVKSGLIAYEIGKGKPSQTVDTKNNRIFHSKTKVDKTYLKYFDGKDICRYITKWSGEYLRYGENLAAPRKNFELFSTKRILVRQIPSKPPYCIHACLIEETALNDRNSMNIINMQETPELILAVLNSKLISYWFVHKYGKMQRNTFPQFKVNELAIFPMPNSFEPHRENLVLLVNNILKAKKTGKETQDLEKQIDELVYQLYNLTPEEIGIIENQTV